MLNVLIIMLGICACAFLLSKANIQITVNHTHKDLTPPQIAPQIVAYTQEQLDELTKKEKLPTFDDALKAVQDALGGAPDGR